MSLGPRWWVAAPFLLLVVVTVAGGWLNTTDARGRIVDDLTERAVKGATVASGTRSVTTGEDGVYTIPTVPKTAKVQIDALGYLRTSVSTTREGDVRLTPLSVTIYASDGTKTENDRIPDPQARDADNTKLLATGNESGQIVIAPHPGKNAQVLLCAAGFSPKRITVEGVLMQVGLEPGPPCAPLPTPAPTPAPTPSPQASPTQAPSPAPSATPSPSP